MTTIKELEDYVNKQTISNFHATIEYVKDSVVGEREWQDKTWMEQTQSILVKQEDDSVWVNLVNKPVLKIEDKGKGISLRSVASKRGFGGVSVNKWDGKKGIQWNIRVTGGADMAINGQPHNSMNREEPKGPDAEDVSGEMKQRGRELSENPDPFADTPVVKDKMDLVREKMSFYEDILDLVNERLRSEIWETLEFSTEDVRQVATSLFIEANKR